MNEHQQKVSSTSKHTHFSSSPTLIYSPVWFVCQTIWQILCYDWSDRLSITLLAKGELHFILIVVSICILLCNFWDIAWKIMYGNTKMRLKFENAHNTFLGWLNIYLCLWTSDWCFQNTVSWSFESFAKHLFWTSDLDHVSNCYCYVISVVEALL